MDNKSWLEIWAEFRIWYKKLKQEGKAPSWRKQQRQIHRIVEDKVKKMGEPRVKRGRGRPRKHPVESHMGAHAAEAAAKPVEERVPEHMPGLS